MAKAALKVCVFATILTAVTTSSGRPVVPEFTLPPESSNATTTAAYARMTLFTLPITSAEPKPPWLVTSEKITIFPEPIDIITSEKPKPGPVTEEPYEEKQKKEEQEAKFPGGQESALLFTLIGINMLLAVIALVLNSSVVAFYWSKSSSLVPMLYLGNGTADLGYGCGILLQSVLLILVLTGADLPYAGSILVLVGYFLTSLFVRLSVFLNCTLGVCRSINIVSPFYHVRKAWLTAATAIYATLWAAIAASDCYFFATKRGVLQSDLYLAKSTSLKAEVGWSVLNSISYHTATLNGVNSVILFFVPCVLPALLCLVLMFLQVYHLKKSTGTTSNRPAVTILIVTTIYVTTNLASLTAWLLVFRNSLGSSFKGLSWSELGVVYFATVTCPLLCATLTPLTLLVRGKGLVRDVSKFLSSFKTTNSVILPKEYSI